MRQPEDSAQILRGSLIWGEGFNVPGARSFIRMRAVTDFRRHRMKKVSFVSAGFPSKHTANRA